MKKLLFLLMVFAGMNARGLSWAQVSGGSNGNLLTYPNGKSRLQAGPSQKYVHQPFPLKGGGKKKETSLKKGKFYSLTQKAIPFSTPIRGKIQLSDEKGNPVTLWPAGQKKNYPTLYQDH